MKRIIKFTTLFSIISLLFVLLGCPQEIKPREIHYQYTKSWYIKDDTQFHSYFVFKYNFDRKDSGISSIEKLFDDNVKGNLKSGANLNGVVTYFSDNLKAITQKFTYTISTEKRYSGSAYLKLV